MFLSSLTFDSFLVFLYPYMERLSQYGFSLITAILLNTNYIATCFITLQKCVSTMILCHSFLKVKLLSVSFSEYFCAAVEKAQGNLRIIK